jgi:hypothetical protein
MPILRGTNSALLPCGCVIGLYETYSGRTVAIVDAQGSACADRSHRVNAYVTWNTLSPAADSRTPTNPQQPQESPGRAQL